MRIARSARRSPEDPDPEEGNGSVGGVRCEQRMMSEYLLRSLLIMLTPPFRRAPRLLFPLEVPTASARAWAAAEGLLFAEVTAVQVSEPGSLHTSAAQRWPRPKGVCPVRRENNHFPWELRRA